MKNPNLKPIPNFKTENEERKFWDSHDSTEYVDWSKAHISPSFPNLKLSTKSVTIRLPESLVDSLKVLANQKDVPYQSLLKVYLSERVHKELIHKGV